MSLSAELENLVGVKEIAEARGHTYGTMLHIVTRSDFPPVERKIGRACFYNDDAVAFFFEKVKFDRRTREGKKRIAQMRQIARERRAESLRRRPRSE